MKGKLPKHLKEFVEIYLKVWQAHQMLTEVSSVLKWAQCALKAKEQPY